MDRGIIQHENALSSWIALRVGRDGAVSRFLKIETDLSLDSNEEAFRKDELDGLIEAAANYLQRHPDIAGVEIEQVPGGALEVTRLGF